MNVTEKDIQEIKAMLKQICNVLGIGTLPPAKVVDIKEKAKQRAIALRNK
jgi:hypothetical protein